MNNRIPLKELYNFEEDDKNVYLTDKNNNKVSYKKELFEDLKKIIGIDVEIELYNLITEEFEQLNKRKSEEL